jgi:hypothetical protein
MAAEDCTPEQMGFIIRYSGWVNRTLLIWYK